MDDMKKLLEEAKRRYTVGTRINSLGGCHNYLLIEHDNIHYPIEESHLDEKVICGYGVTLYDNGKWAEIISFPTTNSEQQIEMWL